MTSEWILPKCVEVDGYIRNEWLLPTVRSATDFTSEWILPKCVEVDGYIRNE